MTEGTSKGAPEVRVLIADDSAVARGLLKQVLESDSGIRVIGMATTGDEAVELTATLKPDLVTMDLIMPGLNGIEATQRIMARHPTPILFFSSFFDRAGTYSRREALAAGALDVMEKPSPIPDTPWQAAAGVLIEKVKSLARVAVVTHMHGAPDRSPRPRVGAGATVATEVVAIGASTGGPRVLGELLSSLPADYRPAIVVIQHLAEGVVTGLVSALQHRCPLLLKIAEHGDRLRSGRVLFAPASAHLTVKSGGLVCLHEGEPITGCRPSVDVAFTAVARVYGRRGAGVLLTGMGTDGAAGLLAIRHAGGVTFVQDETSSAVFGMPRAAIQLGAAQRVEPPSGLVRGLLALHPRRGSIKV